MSAPSIRALMVAEQSIHQARRHERFLNETIILRGGISTSLCTKAVTG